MADILGNIQIAEALADLSKSMQKSNEKIIASLQKLTGIKQPTAKTESLDEEAIQRKSGKVFEDILNVNVSEFGKKALEQLANVLKGIVPEPERVKGPEKKQEESSFLKKLLLFAPLLLPLIAMALKFLAGLTGDKIFEFLANIFPKLFNIAQIGKTIMAAISKLGDYIGDALKLLKETKFGKFFSGIADDVLKFFSPITTFFKENKLIQSIFGEAGVLGKVFGKGGFFAKFFGEGSLISGLFKEGSVVGKIFSGGIFGKLLGGIGKTVLKRLPILGSIFNFYDSITAFREGDYIKGFLSLFSGIANLFPGIGSIISIGLDAINFLFDTEGGKQVKELANAGQFTQAFSTLGDVLAEKIPFLKWFHSLGENIGGAIVGDTESIINLFTQFGLGDFAKWMFEDPTEQSKMLEQGSGINGILMTVVDKLKNIIETFLSFIPTNLKEALDSVYESTKSKIKSLFGFGGDDSNQKTTRELEENLERKKREKREKMQQPGIDSNDSKKREKLEIMQQPVANSNEMLNDFVSNANNYIKRGDEIKQFSKDDNIIGYKKGNELDKSLTSVVTYLGNVAKNGEEYIKIAKEQVLMLQALIEKTNNNIISSNVNTSNYVLGSSSNVQSFRVGAIT